MTREEKKQELIALFTTGAMPIGELIDACFAFADEHPHWISVEDRKPKLKHSADNLKYSDTVIVTDGEYCTSASWMHSTWAGWYGWFTDGDEELKGITHWMPLPKMPKKGGLE